MATITPAPPGEPGEPLGKGLRANSLNFWQTLAIALDSTAPAYSLAAVIGIIVATAGLQAPAILLVAFVPMFLTAMAFAAMNRVEPDCGTTFAWVTRAFGPVPGWLAGWLVAATGIVVIGSLADVAALYTYLLFGWDSAADSKEAVAALAVFYIVVCAAVTVIGIELSGRLQQVLVLIQVGTLLLFAGIVLAKVWGGSGPDTAVDPALSWINPFDVEFAAIATGLVTAVFIYWGWESALAVNEEAENAETAPGRAAVISTVVLLVTYLLVAIAVQGWLGLGVGEDYNDDVAVLGDVASDALGSPLDKLVILAVLTSAFASTQTTILPGSRTTLSMAAHGAFPRAFGRIHPRYRTPWIGTIIVSALTIVWYLPLKFISENFLFDTIGSLGLLIATYYAATGFAAAWYFRRRIGNGVGEAARLVFGPLAGALILTAVLGKAINDYADPANSYSGAWFGVGKPLVIGLGLVLAGIVGMLIAAQRGDGSFFRRRPDAANATGELEVHEAVNAPQ